MSDCIATSTNDVNYKKSNSGEVLKSEQLEKRLENSDKFSREMHPSKLFKDCADCPEMVVIPAGSFEMGNPDYAKPVHRVTLQRFLMGKTELTQRQWQAVMGNNPSYFKKCGSDCPVENVNFDDVQAFIRKFNAKTGKIYRLPSEAEWEYACRAGIQKKYCGSDSMGAVAWAGAGLSETTKQVASKGANAWGLHDMSGNVMEWVQDCSNDNYSKAPIDGSAWMSGDCSRRVLRGGTFADSPNYARADHRHGSETSIRDGGNGFRLARTLP